MAGQPLRGRGRCHAPVRQNLLELRASAPKFRSNFFLVGSPRSTQISKQKFLEILAGAKGGPESYRGGVGSWGVIHIQEIHRFIHSVYIEIYGIAYSQAVPPLVRVAMLRFSGHAEFRQRIVLATLSRRPIRIEEIRTGGSADAVRRREREGES